MSITNVVLSAIASFVAAIFIVAIVLASMKTWTERGMNEKSAIHRTTLIIAVIFFIYALAQTGVLWKR